MKIHKIPVFLAVITIASIFLWFSSCKHDLGIPAGTPEICFDSLVMPIFTTNCSIQDCHNGTGEASSLTSFEEISAGVTPYNPDKSQIYIHITGGGEGLMPPGQPLSIDNRTIIRLWILQGAFHTTCSDTIPVKK
jgi:hypothetical protein